jgi:DNA-binding NtrC family response regulator
MQVKLLRVLQEKRFTPVGSNREIESNVRIVAATNRPLEEMIKENKFREDLFYRLNVLPVHLPALRERKNDIPLLVDYFVERFNDRFGKSIKKCTDETLEILKNYGWPGNIRELENVIEHSFVLESGNELSTDSLPESVKRSVLAKDQDRPRVTVSTGAGDDDSDMDDEMSLGGTGEILDGSRKAPIGIRVQLEKFDFQASKEEFEKQFLIGALKSFKGRINQTALHANIPKKTLLRKLEKYGINARDFIDRL